MAVAVPQFCLRCRRGNPTDAVYCYFDGLPLKATQASENGTLLLGREFVFPSGRRCRSFDEFITACSQEWNAARGQLSQGNFKQFFASIGRSDLAQLADKAAAHVDLDLGLDTLLGSCNGNDATKPRLDIAPRRITLGKLRPGESRDLLLIIKNTGQRLLNGTAEVAQTSWIRLGQDGGGNTDANKKFLFKTTRQSECPIHIETQGLPAGQFYSTTLTVVSNGGAIDIPISFELEIEAYAHAPFQRQTNPHDLAVLMKEHVQEAAEQLSKGEIERWYVRNGWQFPVSEPLAPGIAAVQQYYEANGLSKPPSINIEPQQLTLPCRAGGIATGRITLSTAAKKWIYANVSSDHPWMQFEKSSISGGQSAVLKFQANSFDLPPGQKHSTVLHFACNGGQRHQVPVTLEISSPPKPISYLLQSMLVGACYGLLFGGLLILADVVTRILGGVRYGPLFTLTLVPLLLLGFLVTWRKRQLPFGQSLMTGTVLSFLAAATLSQLAQFMDTSTEGVLPIAATSTMGWSVKLLLCGMVAGMILATLTGYLGRLGMLCIHRLSQPVLWFSQRLQLGPVTKLLQPE